MYYTIGVVFGGIIFLTPLLVLLSPWALKEIRSRIDKYSVLWDVVENFLNFYEGKTLELGLELILYILMAAIFSLFSIIAWPIIVLLGILYVILLVTRNIYLKNKKRK